MFLPKVDAIFPTLQRDPCWLYRSILAKPRVRRTRLWWICLFNPFRGCVGACLLCFRRVQNLRLLTLNPVGFFWRLVRNISNKCSISLFIPKWSYIYHTTLVQIYQHAGIITLTLPHDGKSDSLLMLFLQQGQTLLLIWNDKKSISCYLVHNKLLLTVN